MTTGFAYLLPILAVFIGFAVFGMMAALASNNRKCESCGKVFFGETDLLVHKKVCSHREAKKDVVKLPRAA